MDVSPSEKNENREIVMILCDRHSSGAVQRITNSKQAKTCAVLLSSFIAIALLIGYLLPMYLSLVWLSGLVVLTNAFIPTVPHEPVILFYGKTYSPWLVAICAGVAVSIIELINYRALTFILDSRKIRGFREKRFYQRAEHCFSRFSFSSLVLACLMPVPFIPFRVLAVTTRFSIRKYVLSVFIGRVPRFYLLALVGPILPGWIYVAILTAVFGIFLTKKLAKHRRRKGSHEDKGSMNEICISQ